jgi:hypothetical protein
MLTQRAAVFGPRARNDEIQGNSRDLRRVDRLA